VRSACAQSVVAVGSRGAIGGAALADDLHLLNVAGTNVVAMTGSGGVLLVDGGSADQAAGLAEAIAQLSGGGIVHTLFNTCWHPTQTGSNETLGRAGATIIAHENARLWLTTDVTWPWDGSHFEPVPAAALPNKTFYSKDELNVGGKQVEYGHVRASPHTDGDCYVFFREANVLAVGNAVAGVGWPSIDWRTGGWLGGIVGALELFLVLADEDTRIVPAHGPVLRRADIEAQHEMYDILYERMVQLLYDGKSAEEAVAAHPTAEFDGRIGPSDEFVARAFQSLWGYLTPDA
jgi:glyoxylase-like metal-dependent hydrolase (beta-lactamase superfamily II)